MRSTESILSWKSFFFIGDNVHLKILVPSIAAGAIIGKGGETIAQVQKEAGARVKMSKANDFYPGMSKCQNVQANDFYSGISKCQNVQS